MKNEKKKEKRSTIQNISLPIPIQSSSSQIQDTSPVRPLSSNFSSSQRTFNTELYSALSSVKDTVLSYKNPLNSHSQPDTQLGNSPSRFNNSIEDRSNSLPRTNSNNLPSAIFGYSSNTNDRSRLPDTSKSIEVEKSEKSISVRNEDFVYNSSLSSFDNTTGSLQRGRTKNRDYNFYDSDTFDSKISFINYMKHDKLDREDMRSDKNERRSSGDRLLTLKSQKSFTSIEGVQSRYNEPIYPLSPSDNKSSIFLSTEPDFQLISSPSRFSNSFENRLNSLPRTSIYSLSSTNFGYSSSTIDRNKSSNVPKSSIVKKLGKIVGKINKIKTFKHGRTSNRNYDSYNTSNSCSNFPKHNQLDREDVRLDRCFNSKKSYRGERRPSRNSNLTSKSQNPPMLSYEGDQSHYNEPSYSISQPDNKPSVDSPLYQNFEHDSSTNKFNNPTEYRSISLPRPSIHNLPSTNIENISNADDHIRHSIPAISNIAKELDKLTKKINKKISENNKDFISNSSPSGFNNTIQHEHTNNHTYDSNVTNNSFSNFTKHDQLDRKNMRSNRNFSSKNIYEDERRLSRDRSSAPKNTKPIIASFERDLSYYNEPCYSNSHPYNKSSIYSTMNQDFQLDNSPNKFNNQIENKSYSLPRSNINNLSSTKFGYSFDTADQTNQSKIVISNLTEELKKLTKKIDKSISLKNQNLISNSSQSGFDNITGTFEHGCNSNRDYDSHVNNNHYQFDKEDMKSNRSLNSKRTDKSFNFKKSHRNERSLSRDSRLSSKSQNPPVSFEGVQQYYNESSYSISQPDNKSSIYLSLNQDFQLGNSPSRFDNPIENRSNSLPWTNNYNLPSSNFKYSSNSIDRNRISDTSRSNHVEEQDKSHSGKNHGFVYTSSPTGFDNDTVISHRYRTSNHDYDSYNSSNSFSNFTRNDQLDRESIKSNKILNSKRSDRSFNSMRSNKNEKKPLRDSYLAPKNQKPLSSFEDIQSHYNESNYSLSQPDIKSSIYSSDKFNSTFENKSNSLPRPSGHNLSSSVYGYFSNSIDHSKISDVSRFNLVEELNKSHSERNQDFFYNSSSSTFNNDIKTSEHGHTNNADYVSYDINNSFSKFTKNNQLNKKNMKSNKILNSKRSGRSLNSVRSNKSLNSMRSYKDERTSSRDRHLSSNNQNTTSSFKRIRSCYNENKNKYNNFKYSDKLNNDIGSNSFAVNNIKSHSCNEKISINDINNSEKDEKKSKEETVKEKGDLAITLHDFNGTNSNELSFHKNDILIVTNWNIKNGQAIGYKRNNSNEHGFFPAALVRQYFEIPEGNNKNRNSKNNSSNNNDSTININPNNMDSNENLSTLYDNPTSSPMNQFSSSPSYTSEISSSPSISTSNFIPTAPHEFTVQPELESSSENLTNQQKPKISSKQLSTELPNQNILMNYSELLQYYY